MTLLKAQQRRGGFSVKDPGGISLIKSFRLQPVLHVGDVVTRLGQNGMAEDNHKKKGKQSRHISPNSALRGERKKGKPALPLEIGAAACLATST